MNQLEAALERARKNLAENQQRTDNYAKTMARIWENQIAILEAEIEWSAE